MKTMLVPVDFSDAAAKVIDTALALAKPFGAEIILLHVAALEPEFVGYDPGPPSVRAAVARELVNERREIEKLEAGIKAQGVTVRALVIQGFAAEKIIAEAARLHADAIVMGSHGRGMLHHLLVGSVTEGVLKQAVCPVTIVPVRN